MSVALTSAAIAALVLYFDAAFALPADVTNSADIEGATSLAALPVQATNYLFMYLFICLKLNARAIL